MAARRAGSPKLIWHEHNELTSTNYPLWTYAPFAKRADMIIGVSESVTQGAKQHYRIPEERFCTVHNATDLDAIDAAQRTDARAELGLADDARLIGFGGRLVEQKGVTYLIQAMREVVRRYPDSHLLIIGDGPLRDDLEREAGELGITDELAFLGRRNDIYGILKGLDLYVQPSLWEGLPMVVMEAMGAGLPVVATAVSGTPEVVLEGDTGLLVPPRDPEALANAINQMLGNRERARDMGLAGRRRVEEHFNFQTAARDIEAAYSRLLGTA
jgi:glycosyltransferase involved in cell wall biosynthesis